MPDTPSAQGAPCPRCGTPTPEDLLRRLGGNCSRCLFKLAADGDLPEFPNVEIQSVIGQGGMGVVYRARQPRLNRTVAVKVLSERLMEEPQFLERFEREATAMALLDHPNIVAIHDSGVHGGIPYLVMEHVEGSSLRKRLGQGPIEPRRALEIAVALCDALEYAHGRGVIHRDLKPENILIGPEGRVKMADFGLARLVRDDSNPITLAGARLGTPAYMAPEQGEPTSALDPRADLYALGVVLYEMLTGELPTGRFKPPSKIAPVDSRVDRVVLRLLEKAPEGRPASAAAARADLLRLRASRGRTMIWAGAAAGLALLITGLSLKGNPALSAPPPPAPNPSGWTDVGGSGTGPGLGPLRGPAFRPSVCLDRSGRPVVAWRDDSSGNAEIYLRKWDGTAWVELGQSASGGGISLNAGVSREPSLALDAEDRPVVAWFEEAGGNMEIYLRRWDGQAWVELDGSGSGGGLSRSASRSVHPVVRVDPQGHPVVCWYCIPRTATPGAREIYLRRWDGRRWVEVGGSATEGGISRTRGESYMPSLALDREGRPSVVWHDSTPNNFEIYFRRWNGTAWEELDGSATGGGISRNPGFSKTGFLTSLQLDPEGNPVVVWEDDVSGNQEIYLRRWDGTAWIEVGGSGSGSGISASPGKSLRPSLALDPSGRPYVVWQEDLTTGTSKVYYRHWTGSAWAPLGGSVEGDGIGPTAANGYDPMLALDPKGTPLIVWNDWSPGYPAIYLRIWKEPGR